MRKQDFEKFEEEARQTKARFDSLRFRTSALRTQGSTVAKVSTKTATVPKSAVKSKLKPKSRQSSVRA